MSIDVKADDVVQELRVAFAASIRELLTGTPSATAFQAADALCEVWKETLAGMRVNMPAERVDPVAIAADWRAGRPLAEVMARNSCSRTTAYRYHPKAAKR